MRKMIAALQMSLDGLAQGSDMGGPEWVDSWADALALISEVDAFVQGAGMYPGYAQYWSAIEADPSATAPFSSRKPYEREVAYAQRAAVTPHYVLSRSLDRVEWPSTARIVRDLDALRALKAAPGKNIYVVGGPSLVVQLLNAALIDELYLIVAPLLLGGGKPMFAGSELKQLQLVRAEPAKHGRVILRYRA
ncbi:MAG TPA: dihydrofolate reductase family protein [Polyangiales bacterium]|nr:dihydrofolate reductase family protein [Polyangiales bacterium]